nr:helix-turn-helix transcriptional regulator [uncultured Oscillibacter sp.]
MPMREKKEINVQVGRQIRKAREGAGLTQERFAELIGISPQNVSCVERGLAGVSLTVLRRMCEILHVSSDTLLMGDLGNNDVDVIAERLRQLPPEQFRVVQEVINRLLELTNLSQ